MPELPELPEGFDYLTVTVPVRVDRSHDDDLALRGLRIDVADAAEKALRARWAVAE